MKIKFPILILVFLLGMLNIRQAVASHLLGCDIAWKYMGQDTFLVSVTIYRDCNGVPMPDQPFTIYPCSNTNNGIYINTSKSEGMDITPLCKSSCSRCSDASCAFGSGIEQYIFTAKVNLKSINDTCCDFKIVWQACCRGNIVTTGSDGEQYYVEALVNRCAIPGDNSPVFKTQPVMLFNLNQCNTFSFACSDPDVNANGFHDSLVYLFDQPLQASGTPVTFISPYAYNHPLKYSGVSPNDPWSPNCLGFHLDSSNGDLMFKITKEDISPLNVLVQEWGKNDSDKPYLRGWTHREITFFPQATEPNHIPVLSGINGTDSFSANICAGDSTCFYIDATDVDVNDSVQVTPIMPPGLPNNTITIQSGVQHPRTTFCWKTSSTDAGKTFQFVMKAADNACPVNGRTSRTYLLHVNAIPEVSIAYASDACGNLEIKTKYLAGGPISQYVWTGDDRLSGNGTTIIHHYSKGGNYKYNLSYQNAGGCANSDTGTINIPTYLTLNVHPRDTLFCNPGTTNIDIQTNTSGGVGPFSYKWYSGNVLLPDSLANLSIPVTSYTTLIVFVTDAGGNKCTNWDTVKIKATPSSSPVKLIPPTNTIFCFNQQATFNGNASGGYPPNYSFSWKRNGEIVSGNQYSLQVNKPDTIYEYVTDGCSKDSTVIHVDVRQPLYIYWPPPDTVKICFSQKIGLKVAGSGGNPLQYKYTWDPGQETGDVIFIRPPSDMTFTVTLNDGCSPSVSKSIKIIVKPLPIVNFSVSQSNVLEGQQIQFHNFSSSGTFSWNFGDGTNSALDSPTHQYADTGSYDVTLTNTSSQGCIILKTIKNFIHVLPAYHLYIPNAFTPNADTLNDCFQPKGQAFKEYTLEIFSRYGNTIYKGNKCWDGTYKGDLVMEGMYIYHLSVTDINGQNHSYAGPFYLLIPNNY